MPIRFVLIAVTSLALAPLFGCGPSKLNESKTITLEPGEAKSMDLDGISKAQKLKIEFASPDAEVSVYVFKESDAPKSDRDAILTADPKKALDHKTGKGETFTVDIPENTPARVVVRGATKKTDVSIKLTN